MVYWSLACFLLTAFAERTDGRDLHVDAAESSQCRLSPSKPRFTQPILLDDFSTWISFGTPPQKYNAYVNLFSGETWVPDRTCRNEGNLCPSKCLDKVYCPVLCDLACCGKYGGTNGTDCPGDLCSNYYGFDSRYSKTYRATSYYIWGDGACTLQYSWSPDCIAGLVGIDVITLGNLSIANTPFGQATYVPSWEAGYNADYLAFPMEQLGLGPVQTSNEEWDYVAQNPVIATMAKENNMEPMFSLWFNHSAEASYAEITYGSSNDDRCGNWTYAPLGFGSYIQEDEETQYPYARINITYPGWNVTLSSVRFGNYSFSLPEGYGFNLTVSLNRYASFVVGSHKVLNGLLSELGADESGHFHCSAVPPTLILTLNGNKFELPGSTFVYKTSDGSCALDAKYGQGDSWGLGTNFLRHYCVSVDYGKSTLGIAKNLC